MTPRAARRQYPPSLILDLVTRLGSITRLAHEMGVHPATISRYAYGDQVVPLPMQLLLEAIAIRHGLVAAKGPRA